MPEACALPLSLGAPFVPLPRLGSSRAGRTRWGHHSRCLLCINAFTLHLTYDENEMRRTVPDCVPEGVAALLEAFESDVRSVRWRLRAGVTGYARVKLRLYCSPRSTKCYRLELSELVGRNNELGQSEDYTYEGQRPRPP